MVLITALYGYAKTLQNNVKFSRYTNFSIFLIVYGCQCDVLSPEGGGGGTAFKVGAGVWAGCGTGGCRLPILYFLWYGSVIIKIFFVSLQLGKVLRTVVRRCFIVQKTSNIDKQYNYNPAACGCTVYMNYQTKLRIYEWISYVLIIAATVVYFVLRSQGAGALNLTLCILVVAVFCRLMMERTRRQAADAENDELKNDLRRLTQLYAEARKKAEGSNATEK